MHKIIFSQIFFNLKTYFSIIKSSNWVISFILIGSSCISFTAVYIELTVYIWLGISECAQALGAKVNNKKYTMLKIKGNIDID